MRPGDVALTTSNGKQTSVLEVLDEMRQRWDDNSPARQRAKAIEQWVLNRQNGRALGLENAVSVPMNAPPISKNKLRGLLNTWSARTVKRRDTAMAYANEATDEDEARAMVANAILDYQRQIQDRDALMMRAVRIAGMHSMVGLYNTYDPAAGPHREREVVLDRYGYPLRDPDGSLVYRDVEGRGAPNLEYLSIFEFVTSGEREAHKGKWALIRRWLDPDEAENLLRAKSAEFGEGAGEFKASTTAVIPRQGGPATDKVEAWEMWWRPNKMGRFPAGFFAAVVSGVVVTATEFPYEHGEIPLVVFRVEDVDDDFYGATWLEDAVPQQGGLNHSLRVLMHRAEVAGQMRVMRTEAMAAAWGDSPDGFVDVKTREELKDAVAFEVPDIPADMYQQCDRFEQGIDDTAGVSAVTSSGDVAAETKNARLVAYATQVDEQKNEGTLRNLQEAELVIDSQQLKLYQQFVTLQRLIRVVGEDNAVSANYFSGAEIRGVDVQLFAAPGSERTRAARAKAAEEGTAAGFIDPARGAEMRESGLSGTVGEGEMRQRIHMLIQQAASGQPVQADMTINPDIAVRELRLAVDNPGGDPRSKMALRSLLLEYMDLAAQGAQQAMPQAPQRGAPQSTISAPQNQLPGVSP